MTVVLRVFLTLFRAVAAPTQGSHQESSGVSRESGVRSHQGRRRTVGGEEDGGRQEEAGGGQADEGRREGVGAAGDAQ